jgi:hypothetical protein
MKKSKVKNASYTNTILQEINVMDRMISELSNRIIKFKKALKMQLEIYDCNKEFRKTDEKFINALTNIATRKIKKELK